MLDIDTYNYIYKEEKAERAWIREQKNRILNMTNTAKKQIEWKKLFTPFISDDSYLKGNIF